MSNDLVPELPPFQLTEYVRKAFECNTREQLDDLTRRIWHRYGRGAGATLNAAALERLKARILERRAMLEVAGHDIGAALAQGGHATGVGCRSRQRAYATAARAQQVTDFTAQ